jgi:hypothetical protein
MGIVLYRYTAFSMMSVTRHLLSLLMGLDSVIITLSPILQLLSLSWAANLFRRRMYFLYKWMLHQPLHLNDGGFVHFVADHGTDELSFNSSIFHDRILVSV